MPGMAFLTDVEAVRSVRVDVYTASYRVSGTIQTRFDRVAEILNHAPTTHLPVDQATITEYADPKGTVGAASAHVALDEILLMVAHGVEGQPRPELRIPKRPVRAQLTLPPFRLTGTVHVPQGSRPVDGLLNLRNEFLPMTEVTITSGAHPELGRRVPAVAVRRTRVHVVLVADDERPDELLADVLDERTAEAWLRIPPEERE
jgi:hypothetical protein